MPMLACHASRASILLVLHKSRRRLVRLPRVHRELGVLRKVRLRGAPALQAENGADCAALEPDRVVAVAQVRQLTSFAQKVDVRGRAAEQRCNLSGRRAEVLPFRWPSLAHLGHMKGENPRGDPWNQAGWCWSETLVKSTGHADSGELVNLRARRQCSLPRRRSPVRTRCSAPTQRARRSRT